MPNNMILLETIALTQSAASVTFDNLPTSGYTDLKIVMSGRLTTAGYDGTPWVVGEIRLNNTAITSGKLLFGTGSAAGSDNNANAAFISDTDATANTFSSMDMYLPNYRSSSNKSVSVDVVTENNGTASLIGLQALLSTVAVPVTSISIFSASPGLYAANSTFSLYGIAALGTTPVLAPKATGGNIVANDGTYWYHAFTSSGNFVPQVGLTADCLVIAGGGGGGGVRGGGAGAGGLLQYASQSLTTTLYNVIVGAGGTAGSATANTGPGTNGINSSFGALTAATGGGGGGTLQASGTPANANGSNGGSGGGAALTTTGSSAAGTGTVGQGSNGGEDVFDAGGGGGGATVAGGNATGSTPGAGGNGSSAYSSWGIATLTGQNVSGTYWYAGGGAGGGFQPTVPLTNVGGNGGGGASTTTTGNPGIANTGGGGAGGANINGNSWPGGAGGSGVVIIRYPIA